MTSSLCPFQVGQAIEFDYPETNEFGRPLRVIHRRLHIRYVRDIVQKPLKPETYRKYPYVRRARFLLCGCDLDKQVFRSFYCDAMGNILPVAGPLYRLGVYDPVVPWSAVHFIGGVFTSSAEDQAEMKRQLEQTIDEVSESAAHWNVGVFPWE